LNNGQRIDFEIGSIGRLLASSGWHCEGNTLPVNDSAEASLVFGLPPSAANAVIALDVEPHLQSQRLLGRKHLLGVSANGRTVCAFEIVGPATIQIPLPDEIVRMEGPVVLTLHSVWMPVNTEGDEEILPAMISPRSLTLTCAQAGDPVALPLTSYHAPALSALLRDASLILEDNSGAEAAQLQKIRSRLALQVAVLGPKGLQSYLQEKGTLSALVRIGAESAHVDLSPAEDELLSAAKQRLLGPPGSEPERLRDLLTGMLLAPAPQVLPKPDLADLPKALLLDPFPTAEYLARMPAMRTRTHDTEYLLGYARALLQSIERVLRSEPRGTRLFQLAEQFLEVFHPSLLLFGEENLSAHARLLGQCIETYLIRSGKILGYRVKPARSDRVRLGVIVRDVLPNPEGWLLFGLFSGLKREDYEIWIISLAESGASLDTSPEFEHKLVLSRMSIDEAVATIRGLHLDVLACGNFFHGLERLTTLVAHRLATVQVLFSAIAPMSSGLRNFDYVITSRETEPPDAEAHYTETVRWMPGSFQCFRFEGVSRERVVTDSRAQTRERIGVSEDAVVAVCGAMAQKIGPDLIAAWADLLNRAPQSVLVLYPFASNWGLRYRDDFDRTIRKSFDAASIARSRLVVLKPQSPEAVRRILKAADLYLDSFPYAGATTVVEALSAGLPVITLGGRTQRGLQGAAWVRAAGLDELVTTSAAEYVVAASSLAKHPEKRARLQAILYNHLETRQFPLDPVDFGSRLSVVLREIVCERGMQESAEQFYCSIQVSD
jgi:predicted O-linked N-acetylglucosamine transferase (SPINDLY family)